MEGCGQMPGIVLLCRPTIHHEESDTILQGRSFISMKQRYSCSKAEQDECLMINDLLVGLQDLRDRHRQTQSLAQVSVLLFQSHQAAPKEILVHLAQENKTSKLINMCCCCF